MSAVLADRLEIWGFQDQFTIFSDGSLGFSLKATGLDTMAFNDEDISTFSEKLSSFLNGLPDKTDIQFVLSITDNNHKALGEFEISSLNTENQIAKRLSLERFNRLKAESDNGGIPRYEILILLRKDLSNKVFEKASIFKKQKLFQEKAETNFEEEIRSIKSLQDEVIKSLLSLGIKSESVETDGLFKKIYRQWNPSRELYDKEGSKYDPNSVRDHLVFTDALLYENGFALAETHHRVISLKILPQQVISGMAKEFLDLPIGTKLFVSIHIPEQQKEIDKLQAQRRVAYSMTHGKSGVSDIESGSKLSDVEDILEDLISQKEKIFEMSLQVVLRDKDPEILDEMARYALSVLRGLSGAEGMTESLASFDIFSELSIPNARVRERSKKMKTSYMAEFLPVMTPWEGHSSPKVLMKTQYRTLLKFDPMDSSLGNFNQIISGGSGSGKSFATNLLLLQMLKFSPRIFIIDIGGSYRKICDALGGQYINFSLSEGQSLNPFDLVSGQSIPDPSKIKFLLTLIELMTKEEGFKHLGRLERAEIEEAIKKIYEKSPHAWFISELKDQLINHSDPQIARLGRVLSPWCGSTPFGEFIDRNTTITLDSPIVCFDLKGLENFPDLQAVCLYTITDFIWREVQKNKSQMKFVVFDECWKLLESDSGSLFIGEVFRTFRKYFASSIAISQNIDDFAKSKVATAILSNSSIKWILSQKGADQTRLAEVLQLNPNEHELIKSLTQSKGAYSQSFLMVGDQRALVTIEPTPLEYWLATTDPRDLAALSKAQISQPTKITFAILEDLSKTYPQGIATFEIQAKNKEHEA